MAPRPAPETAPAAMPVLRKSRRVTPMAFSKLPWPAFFSSGLRYIGLAFHRGRRAVVFFGQKIIEPRPAAHVRGRQREQGEHFYALIEGWSGVAHPKRLHRHHRQEKNGPGDACRPS